MSCNEWIPTTSNICERLFSKAKLTVGLLRTSLSPFMLEMLLFLRLNRDLWDLHRVAKAMEPPTAAAAIALDD